MCIFCTCCAFAQRVKTDSAYKLPEVKITSNRLANFSSGTKVQNVDSASIIQFKQGNLATLLENESPLFIKSYGLGSLAVTSFRGGSAQHTAILWNGFNINSPMYGQFDLSLIPSSFVKNVSIQFGGTSTLWGSGAIGGTIHLSNDMKFDKGISAEVGASFGSFSAYGQNIRVEIGKPKWVTSLKFFNLSAANNFPFYNTQVSDSPRQYQRNAELKEYGLLSENQFRLSKRQKINVCFWYQHNDRNIPPIMLQTVNKANQKDVSYRVTSEWQRVGEYATLLARVAYFDEHLLYSDIAYNYESPNRSQTVIAEAESKIRLHKNHLVNIGLNNTYAQAVADGYPNNPMQNRTALFASYRFTSGNEKFSSTVSARQEVVKNKFVPFTYSLGLDYSVLKWLSVKGNASRVYRIPTFNDLYWVPGRNIDLLPESGYCEEAGVLLKLASANSKIIFSSEATVFNRNMDNWILWLPGPGYWSPQNIMKVWSRGTETKSELSVQVSKLKFRLGVITNYVVSTNQKAKTENDASVDKQLIYVPMYSGSGKFSIEYNNLVVTYRQTYTGYRYTSTDNTEYLKPYSIGSVYASYKFSLKKYTATFFAQVNNLFNENYQVLLNRAMPLRNYQAGLSIQFNQPNKNKTK